MSARSESIRFVSGRIYLGVSGPIPAGIIQHDALGPQHFKAAEVFN